MAKKALFKWGELSDRQFTVLTWWTSDQFKDKDGIIADGSIRSGKTISMAPSFIFWAMDTFDGMDFALCGKTVGSLRRNVTNNLKKQIGQRRGWKIEEKRADNLIIVTHMGKVNRFYLFGGKDEASQDLIQGMTLAGIFFDEVALMPESFVDQATGRCSVDGSKYWFNCNPAGPMHWFKKNWIDKCREKNLLYLHFTMEDNLSLSEKIRKRYESMYTGVFFQRYIRGLWVAAEGLIFDMFQKERHVIQKEPDTEGDYIISSDYGIQNATTFLLWRRVSGSQAWVQVDEYFYSGREEKRQKTVTELVDGMETILRRDMEGNRIKPKDIIVDPSAAALIVELKKRGYRVKKADNDVLDGIADVGTMLNEDLLIFTERCMHTIEEFGLYCWDPKASDRGEDRPVKTNDHCMDAVRYFVKTMKLVKRKDKKEASYGFLYA